MGTYHYGSSSYLQLTFTKHLLCASHRPNHFTHINSFNPLNPMQKVLLLLHVTAEEAEAQLG